MPTVLFSDQLIDGYPNAKVILTETSPEQWLESMEKSFYPILNENKFSFLLSMDGVSPEPATPQNSNLRAIYSPHSRRTTNATSSPSSAVPCASGPKTMKTTAPR